MYKKIFRSVCLTAFAVFIASLALIMGMLYQYFNGRPQGRDPYRGGLCAMQWISAARST